MRYALPFVLAVLLHVPAFAQNPDVNAVERELLLEEKAREIYERASRRAWNAVDNSSLMGKIRDAQNEARKAMKDLRENVENKDEKVDQMKFLRWRLKAQRHLDLADRRLNLYRKMLSVFIRDEVRRLKSARKNNLLRKLEKVIKVKMGKTTI